MISQRQCVHTKLGTQGSVHGPMRRCPQQKGQRDAGFSCPHPCPLKLRDVFSRSMVGGRAGGAGCSPSGEAAKGAIWGVPDLRLLPWELGSDGPKWDRTQGRGASGCPWGSEVPAGL